MSGRYLLDTNIIIALFAEVRLILILVGVATGFIPIIANLISKKLKKLIYAQKHRGNFRHPYG